VANNNSARVLTACVTKDLKHSTRTGMAAAAAKLIPGIQDLMNLILLKDIGQKN
jgi:hypothetical protein